MLQDFEIQYDNAFRPSAPRADSLALLYHGDAVFAWMANGLLTLPVFADLSPAVRALPWRYGFALGEQTVFLADGDALQNERPASDAPPRRDMNAADREAALRFVSSRELRSLGPREAVFAAAVGESLHRWYTATRFCGRCGKPMQDSDTERARVCPACALTVYPKICPAVIVAVTDGDRLLLTKYQGRAFKRYALVAGFHEIGETIEQTVRREVLEETGLRVKNLRYYKSQPWVFTDSLLLGFFCELDGSDKISLQENELSEAGWYHRNEIPDDYSSISLTGEMIRLFRFGTQEPEANPTQ